MEALLEECKQCLLIDKRNNASDIKDLDFFSNLDEHDLKSQYKKICEELEKNWAFPTTPIFNLLKHKFRIEHDLEMYEESALTMLQSQGLSFRHQALNQYCKRLMNDEEDELAAMHQSLLEFQTMSKSSEQLKNLIHELPQDWRVVQLSVNDVFSDSRFKNTPGDQAVNKNLPMKLVTVECGEDVKDYVTIHDIPSLPNREKMPSMQAELQEILCMHLLLYKSEKDNSKYKKIRNEVDTRIESLISSMEHKWLGFRKVLFLGKSNEDQMIDEMVREIQVKFFKKEKDFVQIGKRKMIHKIIDGNEYLNESELYKAFEFIGANEEAQNHIKATFKKVSKNRRRKPIVLILDKDVQGLPWESMCFLSSHAISRVPSIHTLALLFKTHMSQSTSVPKAGKIRQDKIFYVLNPDQNLAKTQARLEPTFTEMSLGAGVVGEQPTLPQMKKVLSEMDAYMYCGHGSSLKNLSSQEIEKLNIRALPLLFGCNSGKLERMGRLLDPIGNVHYYLIATAPCLLGFLWSITDKDVDKWTVDFLQHWLGDDLGQPEFVQVVSNRRSSFERMINKCAVVIYGLPSIKYVST